MLTSMPMLFFPRLECSSSTCTAPMEGITPLEARPRMASPRSGCSTLMTSAPQSARMADAAGTKVCSATSRMRTPSMMSGNEIPPCVRDRRSFPDDCAGRQPGLVSPLSGRRAQAVPNAVGRPVSSFRYSSTRGPEGTARLTRNRGGCIPRGPSPLRTSGRCSVRSRLDVIRGPVILREQSVLNGGRDVRCVYRSRGMSLSGP